MKPTTKTKSIATLRDVNSITISMPGTYHSVKVEVGGEMPWPCEPGDVQEFSRGSKVFERLIAKKFARKLKDAKLLLKDLTK